MFDYFSIESSTENPTLILIVFTVLLSLLLSTILAIVYDKTSKEVSRPDFYIQSLVLVAIVAATVMQAIGDSLARGLGMLGALAIIRFRTTLRNPRNIVFMFASLATGIACGVYGFIIAIVGTSLFALSAIILKFSSYGQRKPLIGVLRLNLSEQSSQKEHIRSILKNYCKRHDLERYRIVQAKSPISTNEPEEEPTLVSGSSANSSEKEYTIQYTYNVLLKDKSKAISMLRTIEDLSDVENARITFRKMEDNV